MSELELQKTYNTSLYAYKRDLTNFLFQQWSPIIRYGPFRGIALPKTDTYGVAKILGLYESELHPVFESLPHFQPDVCVNVGSGEGIYCLGLAKLCPPSVPIVGIDTSEECLSAAQFNVDENVRLGLLPADQIRLLGESTPAILEETLASSQRPFVLMDCEGAEQTLLDPQHVPSLSRSLILVEVHPFVVPGIQQVIQERFSATHRITTIQQGAKNVHLPELRFVHENDKYMLCTEGRPETMEWMFLVPHTIPPSGSLHYLIARAYNKTYWSEPKP
jgi:hypothetical protein